MESEICRLFRELREAMDAFQSQAVDPAVIDILHKMHEAMRELFSEVETNRLNSIPESRIIINRIATLEAQSEKGSNAK